MATENAAMTRPGLADFILWALDRINQKWRAAAAAVTDATSTWLV